MQGRSQTLGLGFVQAEPGLPSASALPPGLAGPHLQGVPPERYPLAAGSAARPCLGSACPSAAKEKGVTLLRATPT